MLNCIWSHYKSLCTIWASAIGVTKTFCHEMLLLHSHLHNRLCLYEVKVKYLGTENILRARQPSVFIIREDTLCHFHIPLELLSRRFRFCKRWYGIKPVKSIQHSVPYLSRIHLFSDSSFVRNYFREQLSAGSNEMVFWHHDKRSVCSSTHSISCVTKLLMTSAHIHKCYPQRQLIHRREEFKTRTYDTALASLFPNPTLTSIYKALRSPSASFCNTKPACLQDYQFNQPQPCKLILWTMDIL